MILNGVFCLSTSVLRRFRYFMFGRTAARWRSSNLRKSKNDFEKKTGCFWHVSIIVSIRFFLVCLSVSDQICQWESTWTGLFYNCNSGNYRYLWHKNKRNAHANDAGIQPFFTGSAVCLHTQGTYREIGYGVKWLNAFCLLSQRAMPVFLSGCANLRKY